MAGDGVDIKTFPRLADHHARMAERDSVKKTIAAEAA
jgi:hypothetical protein